MKTFLLTVFFLILTKIPETLISYYLHRSLINHKEMSGDNVNLSVIPEI